MQIILINHLHLLSQRITILILLLSPLSNSPNSVKVAGITAIMATRTLSQGIILFSNSAFYQITLIITTIVVALSAKIAQEATITGIAVRTTQINTSQQRK